VQARRTSKSSIDNTPVLSRISRHLSSSDELQLIAIDPRRPPSPNYSQCYNTCDQSCLLIRWSAAWFVRHHPASGCTGGRVALRAPGGGCAIRALFSVLLMIGAYSVFRVREISIQIFSECIKVSENLTPMLLLLR